MTDCVCYPTCLHCDDCICAWVNDTEECDVTTCPCVVLSEVTDD